MTSPDPTAGPRPDTNDVRAVHGGLRREFRLFPSLLVEASAAGDAGRVAALTDHWALITGILHRHHDGEDELLWPVLVGRSPAVADVVPLMQEQHEAMIAAMADADVVVTGWSGNDQAALEDQAALAAAIAPLTLLAEAVATHFDAEEANILPLVQALMSREEWDALGVHGRAATPLDKLPIVACMLMEDADDAALAAFLAPIPEPVRELATGPWQEDYARYVATLRGS